MLAMHYLRANKLLRLKYLLEFYRKTAAELTNNLTTLQVSFKQVKTNSLLFVAGIQGYIISPTKLNFVECYKLINDDYPLSQC